MDYFKSEFQPSMFLMDYEDGSHFYLCPCQSSESPLPLLILRPLLFMTAIGITSYSQISYMIDGNWNWWFIYLTHWGLMTVIFSTAFSVVVSLMAQLSDKGYEEGLPWYVKIYWVLYNIAKPLSLLITIFYWTVLFKRGDKVLLGLCGHGTNALVMMVLLFSSRQPSRILHFYQPFLFAIIWSIFSVIYYNANGTNTEGKHFIYPVLDWSRPAKTSLIVILTAVALGLFHLLVVAFAALRDWIRSLVSEEE